MASIGLIEWEAVPFQVNAQAVAATALASSPRTRSDHGPGRGRRSPIRPMDAPSRITAWAAMIAGRPNPDGGARTATAVVIAPAAISAVSRMSGGPTTRLLARSGSAAVGGTPAPSPSSSPVMPLLTTIGSRVDLRNLRSVVGPTLSMTVSRHWPVSLRCRGDRRGRRPPIPDRDTAVRSEGQGRYVAVIDRGWWIERGPNGGYLAAIILRAITAEVGDPARRPRTFTVHYLAPPTEGPVEVAVTIERAGRSLTTTTARVTQHGKLVALALAACARSRAGDGFDDRVVPPEVTAGPSSVEPQTGEARVPMAERFEIRPVLGGEPFVGGTEAVVGGWIGLVEPVPVDEVLVVALTDAWMPAIFSRVEGFVAVPTIELTVHFRHPPPATGVDERCYVRFRSRTARHGFVEEDGEVWSSTGRLLAESRQLAAYLPRGPDPAPFGP